MNFQDAILNEMVAEKVPVTLYLMNGFQMRGIITGYDPSVLILITEGKQQIIYKHGISTMVPMRPLKTIEQRN